MSGRDRWSRRAVLKTVLAGMPVGAWAVVRGRRPLGVSWRERVWSRVAATVCPPTATTPARLSTAAGATYELNDTGWEVWCRCDGRHDGYALVETIMEQFGIGEAMADRDVEGFLAVMAASGLVRAV